MLIYKQRYKPRTSRAFTKSDLTVYDSAGNTALNALTVYGKSEVVDGAITSAGKGWATVDLGTLDWSPNATYPNIFNSSIIFPALKQPYALLYCNKYKISTSATIMDIDKSIANSVGSSLLYVKDTDYTDAAAFKAAMSGILLCYELADPTQGNAIAVKTDNGSGIYGTMAVFSTGTPLRGIPDTSVRDVMEWHGSAGTATKNCGSVRLADLTWMIATNNRFIATPPNCYHVPTLSTYPPAILSTNKYIPKTPGGYNTVNYSFYISIDGTLGIKDIDYTTVADFVASLGDTELVYELATPTTEQLTATENASIAGLRTFEPQTHAQNNAQTEMTVDYTIRVPVN